MLKENTKAPDFELEDKDGNIVRLRDFLGKKVVLYFYPKDNTPGCTKQACTFTKLNPEFEKLNAVVIGISKDSAKSHANFANKHSINFTLLSDPDIKVIKEYDVWKDKKLYGKSFMGIIRSTYLIDENGIIIKALEKVNPQENPEQMLELLK